MSQKSTVGVIALLFVAVVFVCGLRWVIRARSETASNGCVNYLRQVDAVKQQWAMDYKKTTNDVPTWEDLSPYLPRWEQRSLNKLCPKGGIYVIGPVGKRPACSIGGRDHTLLE
jgi:hypothetical protein